MTKYTFFVKGMHCGACVILTQNEIQEVPGVISATTSLEHGEIEVVGEFGSRSQLDVMHELNVALKPHGYTLMREREATRIAWNEFAAAVPVAVLVIGLFLLLQKLGIVNLVDTSKVGYGTAFTVGLIASISTCMAIVGSIVLSLSANFAKGGDAFRPQAMFHVGGSFRSLSSVVLLGFLGSLVQFGPTSLLVMSLLVALVLFVLGLNLLDVFSWASKAQFVMPKSIGTRVTSLRKMNHVLTPLVVGVATFFLPCGFTQSMQVYALSTGSFWKGSFTMLAFALGTLPVLALLSFGAVGIQKKVQTGIFFKAVGLVVIFFAFFNAVNALAGAGIIPPLFTL